MPKSEGCKWHYLYSKGCPECQSQQENSTTCKQDKVRACTNLHAAGTDTLKSKGFYHSYGTKRFHEEDVKEFIRQLKEEYRSYCNSTKSELISYPEILKRINKLSGFGE